MKLHKNNFWASYADLMTSLFFVMMILFVLSFYLFKNNSKDLELRNKAFAEQQKELKDRLNDLRISKDSLELINNKLKKIVQIDSALSKLNNQYFVFNKHCKRHELNIDIQFEFNQYDLEAEYIKPYREDLINAGKELQYIIKTIQLKDNIRYLLVIEGRAGRYPDESENIKRSNSTRHLSYLRALSLYNFWKKNDIVFDNDICEVIVGGSGFFGQCRSEEEKKNRRFVIQILPKVGNLNLEN